jgi:hypothetical protein
MNTVLNSAAPDYEAIKTRQQAAWASGDFGQIGTGSFRPCPRSYISGASHHARAGNQQDGGQFLLEQQAYYRTNGGRISWLRIACSGYRPVTSGAEKK